MIRVTGPMLPKLQAGMGFVRVGDPLPSDAVLTPELAVEYASKLIEAAAQAKGDSLICQKARARRVSAGSRTPS